MQHVPRGTTIHINEELGQIKKREEGRGGGARGEYGPLALFGMRDAGLLMDCLGLFSISQSFM